MIDEKALSLSKQIEEIYTNTNANFTEALAAAKEEYEKCNSKNL